MSTASESGRCISPLDAVRSLGVGWGGVGALTSLALTGPALDLWLGIVRSRRGVYLACIAAGLTSNVAAFAVRAVGKMSGLQPGYHPAAIWHIWAPRAIVSYLLCGLLAGLVSAIVCFRLRERSAP